MIPTDRATFKNYCLRKLGAPVIEINVDNDQLEDRIDEALLKFYTFHFDGTEQQYLIYEITDADITNGFIPVSDQIWGIERVLPYNIIGGVFDRGIFDVKYQMMLSDYQNGIYGRNIAYFHMSRQHIALMEWEFNQILPFQFSRKTNELHIQGADLSRIRGENGALAIHCYVQTDVNQHQKVWKDEWLISYTTALIKQQWGVNMKKYDGVQLPGGVTMNGQKIYDEATAEITDLEQQLKNAYELPVDFLIG